MICGTVGDSDDDMATFVTLSALAAGGDGNSLSCMAGLAALKALIDGFDDSDAGIDNDTLLKMTLNPKLVSLNNKVWIFYETC